MNSTPGLPEGSPYWRGKPCPKCGQPNEEDAPYCQHCGRVLARKKGEKGHLIATIAFFIIGLPAFALGACSIYVIIGDPHNMYNVLAIVYGIVPGFSIFLLLLFAAWGKEIKKWMRRMWGRERER